MAALTNCLAITTDYLLIRERSFNPIMINCFLKQHLERNGFPGLLGKILLSGTHLFKQRDQGVTDTSRTCNNVRVKAGTNVRIMEDLCTWIAFCSNSAFRMSVWPFSSRPPHDPSLLPSHLFFEIPCIRRRGRFRGPTASANALSSSISASAVAL